MKVSYHAMDARLRGQDIKQGRRWPTKAYRVRAGGQDIKQDRLHDGVCRFFADKT
ncbi:hypothetical protein [Legionella rubrilucens]|uniref:hypothetical protein n=1 Tax=Legionella rubrilucens TaxID=458 RepID=UPI0012E376BD|nr:hypothetical protein [Legionella rubrilucens]